MREASINLPAAEFQQRGAALHSYLQGEGLGGTILFDPYYIQYYTGFAFAPTERPMAFLMNAAGGKALFVPRLELEHARAQTGLEHVFHYVEYPYRPHPMEVLAQSAREMGITEPIGVDQDGYPWILGYRGPALSEVTSMPVRRIAAFIEDQMAVKSEAEIRLIRESCTWGNLAHRLLQTYTHPGVTETQVSTRASNEATEAMLNALGHLYRSGSWFGDGASAGYRGQIGRNAAIPHALANNITFQAGDVLVTGAGAPVWGYNSELERTMVIGEPGPEVRRFFDHMCRAQEIAIESLRPGRRCADADLAVRAYVEEQDLMPYWKHHTGHAIGLRYHEGPFLDAGDETVLQPGMVFTVEPGLYAPEIGGFRHSDTVLVTEGDPEMLTYYPRDLQSLTIPV